MRIGYWSRILWRILRRLVINRLMVAFAPAMALGAYWFGSDGMLAVAAVAVPVVALSTQPVAARVRAPNRDPVTGLVGTDGLLEAISSDLLRTDRDGRPTCVMVIDIDNMPQLVARLGNQMGTEVLLGLARRLHATLRDSDTVARLDGGRIALLAARPRHMSSEIALAMADRLQEEAAKPMTLDGRQVHLTISVGIALDTALSAASARRLLEAAMLANRDAARHGAGNVRMFSADIKRRSTELNHLAADLRLAFDDGQIEPWYQPQIDTDTGRVAGFEALARWTHPKRGVIPPGDFLDAVEAAGLMARLGETMLFHGLAALRAWDRAGLDVPTIGVNFSGVELRDPKLVDRIRWELERFDIQPQRLSVEIMESVVADGANPVIERNIEGLAKMGCRIDLDDFGTGHASITNIRRFGVMRLKIDRSLVAGIERDPDSRKVVAAILTMAEQLEIGVLAEGVETRTAHAVLAQLGCRYVQGYGVARPIPFSETIPWMESHLEGVKLVLPIGAGPET